MKKPASSIFMRIMRAAADIRANEINAVWVSFFFIFTLMAAYYILRPIRDAMSSDWTDGELSALFTATFIFSITTTILYGLACSRIRLSRLLPSIYIIFSLSFFVFYLLLKTLTDTANINKCFYVWVSVFSLFQVSVFWTFMADTFTKQQAPRLFGFIAAGSSIGAIAGPALALFLVGPLGKSNLILISSLLLLIPVAAILYLEKLKRAELHHDIDVDTGNHDKVTSSMQLDLTLGGHYLSGFHQVMRDPYLLGIGLFVLLFSVSSTFVYFELKNLLAGLDVNTRTQIWSGMDLAVNIFSIVIAFFLTGRLTTKFGLTRVLVLVPILVVMGFLVMVIAPMLWVVVVMQCVRRAGDYSITRPGREMLFTVLEREKLFKAKSVIDNVVYRGGDAFAAWNFTGLTQGLGIGLSAVAAVGAAIAALWIAVATYLGRQYEYKVVSRHDMNDI